MEVEKNLIFLYEVFERS